VFSPCESHCFSNCADPLRSVWTKEFESFFFFPMSSGSFPVQYQGRLGENMNVEAPPARRQPCFLLFFRGPQQVSSQIPFLLKFRVLPSSLQWQVRILSESFFPFPSQEVLLSSVLMVSVCPSFPFNPPNKPKKKLSTKVLLLSFSILSPAPPDFTFFPHRFF